MVTEHEKDNLIYEEISISHYADMLHDCDRNTKYYKALNLAVKYLRERKKKVNVVDIGSGTGLLSMIAAYLNSDCVLKPMAKCAQNIIDINKYSEKISLFNEHSIKYDKFSFPIISKNIFPNIVVSEIFDSELIGEGIIPTINHAIKHLINKNSALSSQITETIMIPSSAVIHGLLLQSHNLSSFNKLSIKNIKFPDQFVNCSGINCVPLQIQMAKLIQGEDYNVITQPLKLFKFDFNRQLPNNEVNYIDMQLIESGTCDCLLVWWELDLLPDHILSDKTNDYSNLLVKRMCNVINTGPPQIGDKLNQHYHWRDHWLQVLYFFANPKTLRGTKGQRLTLACHRDQYSMWFDILDSGEPMLEGVDSRVANSYDTCCNCYFHLAYNRRRMAYLNEANSNFYKLVDYLKRMKFDENATFIVISDGSLLPIYLAHFYPGSKSYVMDGGRNQFCTKAFKDLISCNGLKDRITVLTKDPAQLAREDFGEDLTKIDAILGEPYFVSSLFPWDDLYFYYCLLELIYQPSLRSLFNFDHECRHKTIVFPLSAKLKAVAVNFKELWKTKAPVYPHQLFSKDDDEMAVDDDSDVKADTDQYKPFPKFDMSPFNEMMKMASIIKNYPSRKSEIEKMDTVTLMNTRTFTMDSNNLWEYEFDAVSSAYDVFSFDANTVEEGTETGRKGDKMRNALTFKIGEGQSVNGVILYMNYYGISDTTPQPDTRLVIDNGFAVKGDSHNRSNPVKWKSKHVRQGYALLNPPYLADAIKKDDLKIELKFTFDFNSGELCIGE
ncbi:unnamed protein product [Gordionus sp. m RMFG-2023]|uniref:protein arginine N-methyltransferase 7-like isoform X2 n=1 Tax=Gordionus sp. m RMFG-2023 TaxID=3053472 RepID=UPI0030DFF6C1